MLDRPKVCFQFCAHLIITNRMVNVATQRTAKFIFLQIHMFMCDCVRVWWQQFYATLHCMWPKWSTAPLAVCSNGIKEMCRKLESKKVCMCVRKSCGANAIRTHKPGITATAHESEKQKYCSAMCKVLQRT